MINNLSREVKLIPTKWFTKDLINEYNILNGAKYFARNVSQTYLLFQSVFKYFKTLTNSSRIIAWGSKGLLKRSIKSSHRPFSLGRGLNYISNAKIWVKPDWSF